MASPQRIGAYIPPTAGLASARESVFKKEIAGDASPQTFTAGQELVARWPTNVGVCSMSKSKSVTFTSEKHLVPTQESPSSYSSGDRSKVSVAGHDSQPHASSRAARESGKGHANAASVRSKNLDEVQGLAWGNRERDIRRWQSLPRSASEKESSSFYIPPETDGGFM